MNVFALQAKGDLAAGVHPTGNKLRPPSQGVY